MYIIDLDFDLDIDIDLDIGLDIYIYICEYRPMYPCIGANMHARTHA